MGATQGEDPWLKEPLPRGIGGLVCRSLPWIMRGNVVNAKGTPQISTNPEGF